MSPLPGDDYMQISERPQTSKPQQILNCLPYIEQK